MSESGLFWTRLADQTTWIKSPEVSQLYFLKCKKNLFKVKYMLWMRISQYNLVIISALQGIFQNCRDPLQFLPGGKFVSSQFNSKILMIDGNFPRLLSINFNQILAGPK